MLHFAKLSLISQLVVWKNLKELEKGEEEKVRQGVVIEADVFLALCLIFLRGWEYKPDCEVMGRMLTFQPLKIEVNASFSTYASHSSEPICPYCPQE